jgi:hypothetical protein
MLHQISVATPELGLCAQSFAMAQKQVASMHLRR